MQQRRAMSELHVICPYNSAARPAADIIAKQHPLEVKQDELDNEDDEEVFVFDTDAGQISAEPDHNDCTEGMQKVLDDSSASDDTTVTGCEWSGKYKQLMNHIDYECVFVPVQDRIKRLQSQLDELKSQIPRKETRRNYKPWQIGLFCVVIVVLLCVGYFVHESVGDTDISNMNMDEVLKFIDEQKKLNEQHERKWQQVEKHIDDKLDDLRKEQEQSSRGWYERLTETMQSMKQEVLDIDGVPADNVHDDAKKDDLKQERTEEANDESSSAKYEAFDELLETMKIKYDGYKQKVDAMPWVQFVSDSFDKLTGKKEL